MRKVYIIGGRRREYEEGHQPAGAVEAVEAVKPSKAEPAKKAVKPANKARVVKTK